MTLEINEISIQITVGPQPHEPAHAPLTIPAAAAALQNGQIEQIVEQCVQSVLQQLRRRERR